MRKIFGILSVFLLPAVTFAQSYGYRMMNFGNGGSSNAFGCDSSMWFLPSLFVVPLVRIVVGIAVFIFWLMMLIDAIKHSPEKMKIVWVLVIIFTHVVGALIYYFVEKRPKHTAKVHAEK